MPLAIYCVGFGAYGGYRYMTLDKSLSRVPIRSNIPWHYPLLTTHILTGVVAVCIAWTQVWPWLRETRPRWHRRLGWTYFLVGVFPSGLLAFPVAVLSPHGQQARLVLLAMATLWAITAVSGFRAAIQHRYEDHRRWMLRNVALTTSTITARPVYAILVGLTNTWMSGVYGHQQTMLDNTMDATSLWISIVSHLGYVEWVALRPRRRRRAAPSAGRAHRDISAAG